MATAAQDWPGRAHAIEVLGVASWRRQRRVEAVVRWRQALGLHRELGEDQGAARCLLHLGSVALLEPPVAGVKDSSPRALHPAEAAAVAVLLLAESLRLRAGQGAAAPGTRLAQRYLELARERVAGSATAVPSGA